MHLREGATDRVAVDEREPAPRCSRDGVEPVPPADLAGHEGDDRAAQDVLDGLAEELDLVAGTDLLRTDRWRADPPDRHQDPVLRQVVEPDEADGSVLGEGLPGHEGAGRDLAAPAGPEDGAAAGQCRDVVGVEVHASNLESTQS